MASRVEELTTLMNNFIKNGHGKANDTNVIAINALLKRLDKTSPANLTSFMEEILAAIASLKESTTANSRTTKKRNEKCSDGDPDSDQDQHDFRTSEVLAMKLAEVMVYIVYYIKRMLLLY